MKKITNLLSFLFCLFYLNGSSQVQKLSELSKNQMINSKIIYDDKDPEEVWGYAILYLYDLKSAKLGDFELVVLDKNLNKVGSVVFEEYLYSYKLVKKYPILNFIMKKEDKLFMSIQMKGNSGIPFTELFDSFFRELDLKDFKISPTFIVSGTEKITFSHENDHKGSVYKKMNRYRPFKNKYLVRYDQGKPTNQSFVVEKIELYDTNFKKLATQEVPVNYYSQFIYSPFAISDRYVVFLDDLYNPIEGKNHIISYRIHDIETNMSFDRISSNFNDYVNIPIDIKFVDDKIIVYQKCHEAKGKSYSHNPSNLIGISEIIYDTKSKSVISRKVLTWSQISKKLPIDSKGALNREIIGNHFYFLDTRHLSNGNTILVAGNFASGTKSSLLNLYFFEVDNDFKVVNYFTMDENFQNISSNSKFLKSNVSEYLFSQETEPNKFIFFYNDNEKKDKSFATFRKNEYVMYMITYENGKFDMQKMNMSTSEGEIYPLKAKKGHIILQEEKSDGYEIRIEKLND